MPDVMCRDFLRPKDLAHELGITVDRARKLIRERKIPAIVLGPRTQIVPRRALEEIALRAVKFFDEE